MSNPTGNAIKAAAIPDAREARLLALAEEFRDRASKVNAQKSLFPGSPFLSGTCAGEVNAYQICARAIEAALTGDA